MKTKSPSQLALSIVVILSLLISWGTSNAHFTNSQTQASILYVSQNASGSCASWANACDLQTALTTAQTGDQIWVAAGYHITGESGNREATFQLKSGVAIYGGFDGTETSLSQRDFETNLTILSGDVGAEGDNTDNAYHVVTGSGVDATAILDGFTITGGFGLTQTQQFNGGGMNNLSGSPTLTNVIFTENNGSFGGGMYNYASSPTLVNVTFHDNWAAGGGGVYNDSSSSPTITDTTFIDNTALISGGGMENANGSHPTLSNVLFSGNIGDSNFATGGGMMNTLSNPTLTNVTFSDNFAVYQGGAMYNQNSSPILTNVTFFSNYTAVNGGAIASTSSQSNPVVINSIFWGNLPDQVYVEASATTTITYSVVQGGWAGTGNLDLDPLLGPLADNGGFNFTHALYPGSPAIDAGDPANCPASDQRGLPRPIDGDGLNGPRCDMGAYEFEMATLDYPIYLPMIVR